MTREEQILICAVRYALGRRSYIVGIVAEYVVVKRKQLSKECRSIIIKDIKEDFDYYHGRGATCGDECDEHTWEWVLQELKEVE